MLALFIIAIFLANVSNTVVVIANSAYDPWDHDSDPKTPDVDTNGWTISGEVVLDKDLYFNGDGLTIDGDGSNLNLNGHCIVGMGFGIGIKIVGKGAVIIDGGEVCDFEKGIYLENSHNIFISNMVVRGNNQGIYLLYSGQNKIDSNIIKENNDGMWGGACDQNVIRGNLIQENIRDGIQLISCSDNLIGGNCIEGNGRHGIKLEGGEGIPSANNQAISNSLSKNKNGLYLMNKALDNMIESNSISKNDFGIQFDASVLDPLNNVIRGNVICKNDIGVRLADKPHNNRVVMNSIFDNKEWGVMANSVTIANFNWWGDEEGPIVGEDVTDDVIFTPWLEWKTIG